MNPKISIIVPVYNVESFLQECIESILNQEFKDFELILVNDGSTDRSGNICDEYESKDNRVKVIHKENEGQSSARNRGIDAAKGSFIGFVDSDDWVNKQMFKVLYSNAIEQNADIIACNLKIFSKDGTSRLYYDNSSDFLYDKRSAMEELYKNEKLTFSPCNKIYKKELLTDIRFKEGSILEDMDFAYRIIHQADTIYYSAQALYYYRFNENSTMRKVFSKKRLDEYEIRKDMYLFYQQHYPHIANEVYAEWFLTGLLLYINIKKYFKEETAKYRYLVHVDRKKLKPLIKDNYYNPKKRLLLKIANVSPKLLVVFYSLYWDKIKKEL
ncbi:glycosyltransferase family 2 protein [Bacillus sp. 1P02SD]|uniref:glycosyltransferase family 2 protein n=1 Tax=Bacillus sp. 1P02SD TaxID=3132264 RepID=UPI0039A0AC38